MICTNLESSIARRCYEIQCMQMQMIDLGFGCHGVDE
jgi:hypothetical protein